MICPEFDPDKIRALENVFQRCVNALPLDQQLFENQPALWRETVETFVALVFFAPLAYQQTLSFQAAKQRVERAFVDGHAVIGQGFPQRVAIVLGAQRRQDREGKASAAKLLAEVFEAVIVVRAGTYARRHIVYDVHCMSHSMGCQE